MQRSGFLAMVGKTTLELLVCTTSADLLVLLKCSIEISLINGETMFCSQFLG